MQIFLLAFLCSKIGLLMIQFCKLFMSKGFYVQHFQQMLAIKKLIYKTHYLLFETPTDAI
jgi:hypothetical protein